MMCDFMQKDRDLSFDAFRGVAIIAVVAIHSSGFGFSWRYSASGRWNFTFIIAYIQLLLFAVPALIFMSGYWSSKSPIKSLKDYTSFLTRKLPRVLIPYLFWSFVVFGYTAIQTGGMDIRRMVLELLTGGACFPYYFIIVIIQLYMITPLLQYVNRRAYGLMLVLVFSMTTVFALYLSRVYSLIWHLPAYLPFYSWIIFYEIGLLTGDRYDKKITFKSAPVFILSSVLICLLISELEGMILLSGYDNLGFAISPVKYSSILYSVCIICGFLFLRGRLNRWPKFLVAIGNYSFGIYLIHIFVLGKVAGIVQKAEIIYSFQLLYQFIVVLITIPICFLLISVTRRLLAPTFCRKVLGF
jgi:surface polysaccharide O-acyltransferase-like enzyme